MKLLSTILWLVIALSSTVSHAAPVTRYIHNDVLGSPIAATDQNGDVVWKEEYKPFGERIIKDGKADTQKRWFTGHVQDKDTGLVYMGARFYDPSIGRFLSPDPVGFNPSIPALFNRYAYANNNPYKYVDPDGRLFTAFHMNRKGISPEQAVMVGAMGNTSVEVGDAIMTASGVAGIVKGGVKYGVMGLAKVIPKSLSNVTNTAANFTQKQLAKKFKHASDFGVNTTKKNADTFGQFQTAIKSHLDDAATAQKGRYGFVQESKVFFNQNTNNAVVLDKANNFVTGFKLKPGTKQFDNFINKGLLR